MNEFSFSQLETIKEIFESFNTDGTGYVSLFHAVFMFNKLGFYVTEDHLKILKKEVIGEEGRAEESGQQEDDDEDNEVNVHQFVSMLRLHCSRTCDKAHSEQPYVDAFVALGGSPDKSGHIQADKITDLIKRFNLDLDIFTMCRKGDYDEISHLLKEN
eukprot:gb/GECH01007310.1/.p1 GENE.gb/GECH01007310.1/~~gb/GECH01007310.1/.p1  ORF type:complete len:158 (+),score=36.25 gb/GECH01007310.1/:1-474(+)